ncbi:MAG: sulfotransferase [Spirochaetales bacterium]|nr:sulfotransferase [Spirochaetales bacterium]
MENSLTISPFFIIGTGRCGTQLLRNMLIRINRISIFPETHFLPILYSRYGLRTCSLKEFLNVIENIKSSSGDLWITGILRDSLEKRDISSYAAEFGDYILTITQKHKHSIRDFYRLFAEFIYGPDKIIGDKSPHYGVHAASLLKLWPEARFIYLMRDGVPSILSMLHHPGFRRYINSEVPPLKLDEVMLHGQFCSFDSKKPGIKKAVAFWKTLYKKNEETIPRIPEKQILKIYYEYLVINPQANLKKIINFLGIKPVAQHQFKKACAIPKPFYKITYQQLINSETYKSIYKQIKVEQEKQGYPLHIRKQITVSYILKEIFRTKNSLFSLQRLKKGIKRRLKK